jgi:hypothetical protein
VSPVKGFFFFFGDKKIKKERKTPVGVVALSSVFVFSFQGCHSCSTNLWPAISLRLNPRPSIQRVLMAR